MNYYFETKDTVLHDAAVEALRRWGATTMHAVQTSPDDPASELLRSLERFFATLAQHRRYVVAVVEAFAQAERDEEVKPWSCADVRWLTTIRAPLEGRNVTPLRRCRSSAVLLARSSQRSTMVAGTVWSSSSARREPTQRRLAPPKGRDGEQAIRAAPRRRAPAGAPPRPVADRRSPSRRPAR